jgi:hypothetical protein
LLAAVYHGRRDIRVQEWPALPSPQPGWVTIGNVDAQRRFLGVEPLAVRRST